MRKLVLVTVAVALLAGLAVVSAEEPAKPEAPAPAAGTGDVAPVVAEVKKPHYAVTVTAPKGCGGAAQVTLAPQGHYKFNKAYPTKVKVTPPAGVEATKPVLKKKDASSLTDAGAVFPVAYTCTAPAAGEVSALASFSVCDDKTCKMIKETVAWSVAP